MLISSTVGDIAEILLAYVLHSEPGAIRLGQEYRSLAVDFKKPFCTVNENQPFCVVNENLKLFAVVSLYSLLYSFRECQGAVCDAQLPHEAIYVLNIALLARQWWTTSKLFAVLHKR